MRCPIPFEFTYQRIKQDDLTIEDDGRCHVVLPVRAGDRWTVAYEFADIVKGWRTPLPGVKRMMVPLLPYLFAAETELSIAFSLRIGFAARNAIAKPVAKLHMIIVDPVEELPTPPGTGLVSDKCWRCRLGVAVLLA